MTICLDVLPPDVIEDILTNDLYGLGLDSSYLNSIDFDATRAYCEANDFKVSMVFGNKISVLDALQQVISHHNGYISYSNGQISHNQLKSETAVGSIDTGDLVKQKQQFPIQINKGGHRDYNNKILLEYTKRDKEYVTGTALADDMLDIDTYGLKEASVKLDGLTSYNRAETMANILLRKSLINPEQISCKLGPKSLGIKPGEVWTFTDTGAEISNKDYRIITIGESDKYEIEITAQEEIPEIYIYDSYGSDTSTQPVGPDFAGDPGSVIRGTSIELPALYSGLPCLLANTYSNSGLEPWAGTSLYKAYSETGSYAKIESKEWSGITGLVIAMGTDNYVKYIDVELDYDDTLSSATSFDDLMNTPYKNLVMIRTAQGDKFVRFQDADLIGTRQWRLSNLIYDTVSAPKLNETTDIAVSNIVAFYQNIPFNLTIPDADKLRTLWFKVASFNFKRVEQSLADVVAISITMQSLCDKPLIPYNIEIDNIGVDSDNTIIRPQSEEIIVEWKSRNRTNTGGYNYTRTDVILDDAEFLNFTIEVYVGAVLKRTVVQTAKTWTYTVALQTTDGTLTNNLIFKIRQDNNSISSDWVEITITRV